MAKLQRTLGENVPLELVFGRPKTDKKTRRRSRSVAHARPGVMDLFAEDKDTKPTQTSTGAAAASSSTTPIQKDRKHRQHRPRSLTLGSASALVAADIKLAEQQNHHPHHDRRMGGLNRAKSAAAAKKREGVIKPLDTRGTVSMDEGMRRGVGSSHHDQSSDVNEEWRRKERGWSGEWNVRDMQEVAKALRGLKAR
jgi:hypothetical protein